MTTVYTTIRAIKQRELQELWVPQKDWQIFTPTVVMWEVYSSSRLANTLT